MKALARYAYILLAVGVGLALVAAGFRLVDGVVSARVQATIAAALLLLAAYLALEVDAIQKWSGGRQARYGANAVAMSVAFVGIIAMVNYLSNDRYHAEWDLTENKANTLADQTLEVLADLPEPVTAQAFVSNQTGARETTTQLLQSYADKSNGLFTFEVVDPFVEPVLAQQMGVTRDNTVVFVLSDRQEQVQFGTEQEFTAALIRLTHPETRVLYFVIGHGEHDIADGTEAGYSQIKASLERQNYTIETLNTVVTDTVPSDAVALIVAGPQTAFTAAETQAIGDYLNAGGAALFLINPTVEMREGQAEADALSPWLGTAWGITVTDDLVVDPASSNVTDPFTPVSLFFGNSPITDKLSSQSLGVVFRLVRSIGIPDVGDPNFPNVQYTGLVFTSSQAWGETDFGSLQQGARPDEGVDAAGPLNMAVSGEDTATGARVVVYGDSDFVSNAAQEAGANNDIFVASVNWATGNTDLISIPPRDAAFRPPLDLSTRTIATLGIVSVLLLPFGVLVAGVFVVLNRRARYK